MFTRFLIHRPLSMMLFGVIGVGLLLSGCGGQPAPAPSPAVETVAVPSATPTLSPSPSVKYVSQMTQEEKYAEAERVVRDMLDSVNTIEQTAEYAPSLDAILECTAVPYRSMIISGVLKRFETRHELPSQGETYIEVRADRYADLPRGMIRVDACRDSRGVQFFKENGDLLFTGNLVIISYDLIEVDGRFKILQERGGSVDECSLDS